MNNIALLFILFIMMKGKDKSPHFPNTRNTLYIDIKTTTEKIKLIKKIGPYFPEEYLPSINKAIMITEKIVKLYEVFDFICKKDMLYVTESIPVENLQKRLSYIANTIQKDFAKEDINRLGVGADIILKIDRLNKMMNMFSYISSNPDIMKDTNSIFKLVEPLLQDKDEKEMKKIKEMTRMMNILKALDTTGDQKEKKDEKKENL